MHVAVNRFAHCNVNCSSLERSRPFYEDVVGLKAYTHTNPPLQERGSFPVSGTSGRMLQWDAWIMHDHRGPLGSPAVDLLEWKTPTPTGSPYREANHLGLYRLCYLVPSIDDMYARFTTAGVAPYSPPTTMWLGADRTQPVRVFCAPDPDGTCLEFVESDSAPSTASIHVNINCSDLGRSLAWYTENFGFEVTGRSAPGPQPGAALGLDGDCEWEACFLSLPGQSGLFLVDLVEWRAPQPTGRPYAEANHVGIFRVALMVDDIHASHRTLLDNGVTCFGPPAELDMGPEVPVDGLWALFCRDPDGACVELIEEPRGTAQTTRPSARR
jgi:catechol 2,3-dioxygenase-like lactoylglutathione lyase family enzyme